MADRPSQRWRWAPLRTSAAAGFVVLSLGAAIVAEPSVRLRPCGGSTFTSAFAGSLGFGTFRREVFLRQGDGSVTRMTWGGVSNAPSISADARTLVYLRGLPEEIADAPAPGDELVVRPLTGAARSARVLARASFLFDPDLSPDGRYVAVSASMRPSPPVGPRPPLPRAGASDDTVGGSPAQVPDQFPANRIYVLDTRTAAVVGTVPAPPGAVREEQLRPVFSPDGTALAYESNVSTTNDVRVPRINTVRIVRLGSEAAGRPVLSLSTSGVRNLEWSPTVAALSVTRSEGVDRASSWHTTVFTAEGRLLRDEPTPHGVGAIPAGRAAGALLLPEPEVPVLSPSDFDVAGCALQSG